MQTFFNFTLLVKRKGKSFWDFYVLGNNSCKNISYGLTTYLESFMALVMAYSLSPSWRSMSLKVPIQPQTNRDDTKYQEVGGGGGRQMVGRPASLSGQ